MQPTIQLREGVIVWQQVLDGSTANTLFPSSLTAGVAPAADAKGNKVYVGLVANATAGTSCTVSLLGLVPSNGGLGSTSTWVYIGSLNGGSSITPNTSKWTLGTSTTLVQLVEGISTAGEAFERFTTNVVLGGTGTAVSTWVGVLKA